MAAYKGKYAGVIDSLPQLPGVEPERHDLVEAVKQDVLASVESATDYTTLIDNALEDMGNIFEELPHYFKRVTEGKRHASEFARVYAKLRSVKDTVDTFQSNMNLVLEAYTALMLEQMEVEGITSMKLENGQPLTTFQEPYAQVTDKEAFRNWFMADPDLSRLATLQWQKINSITKERLLAGESEPDGVTCYAKTKIRLGKE